MKYISLLILAYTVPFMSICLADNKRPKHKPKQNIEQNINNQKNETDEEQEGNTEQTQYRPNPVVLAGVGHIMNGALSIAQNPHSRPNLGHSIASILHGIMSIIVEKVARKNVDINDKQALEECLNEICSDMSEELTEIIVKRFTDLHYEENQ